MPRMDAFRRSSLELLEVLGDLVQRVAVELRPVLQFQQAQHLIVLDAEDLVFRGRVVARPAVAHHVQQPAHGRLFDAGLVLVHLPAADDDQCRPGQRVQRLDPAAVHDRDHAGRP